MEKYNCNMRSSICFDTDCLCNKEHEKNESCNNHPYCYRTKKVDNTYIPIKQECIKIPLGI